MNDINLSEQIRKLRMSKKFTLAVMAERLGVTTSTVAAYENGTRNPSFEVLMKIARIFNVTVDTLLGGTDKDLIDVSDLIPEQRDDVENLISLHRKFNYLLNEMFESKQSYTNLKGHFESNFDEFARQITNRKDFRERSKEMKRKLRKKYNNSEEKIDETELDNNENDKVKDLEDRIKILEEIINQDKKNNDT